jgi:hypothetical protein
MSIFTILTYAMLIMVVLTGLASIPRKLGNRWDLRGLKRRALQSQERRVLRPRA